MAHRTGSQLLLACLAIILAGLPAQAVPTTKRSAPLTSMPSFNSVAAGLGIDQQHPIFGPNLADFNNDGRLDILLTNHAHGLSLLRQLASGHFRDTASAAGLDTLEDYHGAAWGDCDNDGFLDLYIGVGARSGTGSIPKKLYHNLGNGTFVDVAADAGVADPTARNRSASWVDFNNDGNLDLYVTNFPRADTSDRLYMNMGNCSFVDVSTRAGAITQAFRYFGASWADYDLDGDMDVFATGPLTTTTSGQVGPDLLRNNGDGSFTNVTSSAGIRSERVKGIAWGDYDNDGDADLFLTQYYPVLGPPVRKANRLYRNNGNGTFSEVAANAGVASNANSQDAAWGDFDNDGDLDLFVVNAGDSSTQNYPDLLFENLGKGTFQEVGSMVGLSGATRGWGGAAAVGDLNRDGALDLVVTNGGTGTDDIEGPHQVFVNEGTENHWVQIRLVGTRSNRLGIGARVVVRTADGSQQTRQQYGGIHRWSQDDMVLTFGLGAQTIIRQITVYWPSGVVQRRWTVPVDRRITVIEHQQ